MEITCEEVLEVIRLADKCISKIPSEPVIHTPSELADDYLDHYYNPDPDEVALDNYVDELSPRKRSELAAIMLIGRGDAGAEDWNSVVSSAGALTRDNGDYITSKVLALSDYLRDGLRTMGMD